MELEELPETAAQRLRQLRKKYTVALAPLKIRDHELQLLQVTDLEELLAGKDPFRDVRDFPFWVRLWEAAMVLADLIAAMPPKTERSLLELGAGLGAPGLVAAASGYNVTLSDYEPHILDFQRISAAASGLDDRVRCTAFDWLNPPELGRFDTIIGAEILFREEFFEPLLAVFRKCLKPDGVIYLAHDVRRKSLPQFLLRAEKEYEIAVSTRKMTTEDTELTIIVNRLKPRPVASV